MCLASEKYHTPQTHAARAEQGAVIVKKIIKHEGR